MNKEEALELMDEIDSLNRKLRKLIKEADKEQMVKDIPDASSWRLPPFSCRRCDGVRLVESLVHDTDNHRNKRILTCMDCGYSEEEYIT